MEYKEIQDLIKLVKKNNIAEVKIQQKDFKISIKTETEHSVQISQLPAQPVTQNIVAAQPAPQMVEPNVPAPAQVTPAAPSAGDAVTDLIEIKSPMIGTFYRSPGPDKDPFVSIGDIIAPGQVICMIEAMKLFNEIEAEVKGKVVKILVEDATPVEFDQPLFLIDPKG